MTSVGSSDGRVSADQVAVQAEEHGGSELGTRLRQLRKSRGVSLAEVAEGTGISASFLSMVEKGKSDITVSRLMRLVHWFGVSIADLVQEPDRSPSRSSDPISGARSRSPTSG